MHILQLLLLVQKYPICHHYHLYPIIVKDIYLISYNIIFRIYSLQGFLVVLEAQEAPKMKQKDELFIHVISYMYELNHHHSRELLLGLHQEALDLLASVCTKQDKGSDGINKRGKRWLRLTTVVTCRFATLAASEY